MTNKAKTYEVLTDNFLEDNKLDSQFLTHNLELTLDNTYNLATRLNNKRASPLSLAKATICELVNVLYGDTDYKCTYVQIKTWLTEFGNGESELDKLVAYITESRKEVA